jgi:hypothetical protein
VLDNPELLFREYFLRRREMKYELTEETIEVFDRTLRRIRYLETGEVGGWLESEKNLSQDGDAQVYGDARVSGNARVYGNAQVYGNAWVYGNARVYGNAQVYGDAWEVSPLQIQGTKYFFSVSSKTSIRIGCTDKTVDAWLASYEHGFDEYGFTEKERIEYKLYFNLAATLYGWEVPLFSIDKIEGEA